MKNDCLVFFQNAVQLFWNYKYCVTKKYPQLKYRLNILLEMQIRFFYLLKHSWLGVKGQQRDETIQEPSELI